MQDRSRKQGLTLGKDHMSVFSNLKESSKHPETGRECVLQGPRGSGATYAQLNLAGLGISCSSREKGEIQTGEAP